MRILKPMIKNILLIDDDADERMFFSQALKKISPSIQLHYSNNCDDIVTTLYTCKPDLVFLDINISGISGFNCLKQIRDTPTFIKTPVIMYSNSEYPNDINYAYGLGATLYFTKTPTFDHLVASLKSIIGLSWQHPNDITAKYFANGKYLPFTVV